MIAIRSENRAAASPALGFFLPGPGADLGGRQFVKNRVDYCSPGGFNFQVQRLLGGLAFV